MPIRLSLAQQWLGQLFATLLLLLPLLAVADELRIIQLKHRPASEIAPLIRPLLAPGDALSSSDFRLIVRTSDRRFDEIQRVIQQVDVARRNLMITVQHATIRRDEQTNYEISGGKKVGDGRIVLPRKSSRGDDGTAHDGIEVQAQHRGANTESGQTQRLRVLDGSQAYIRVGQSVPHVEQILILTGHQAIITQDVRLQSVVTGFDVRPRVQGERVQLEITPRLSSLEDSTIGRVNFQELATTVSAKLGEWIDLGAVTQQSDEVYRAILASGSHRADERRTILLRVE